MRVLKAVWPGLALQSFGGGRVETSGERSMFSADSNLAHEM